jgi:Arc/MetJ family transcription regulator
MKLSAHVPDELWARAAALHDESGPSQLVQLALRHLVERSRPRFAGKRNDQQDELLALRQSRVARLAQSAYDEGYEAGLLRCEELTWCDLERLAAASWSAAALAVHEVPGAEARPATSAFRTGFRDALRDAWLGAMEADEPSAAV